MAKLSILAGSTSQSVLIFAQDSSSTIGAGLTGLVYNSSGLTCYYTFAGANTTSTAITLATLSSVTTGWVSGGFLQVDSTNMPGVYRLDLPNAVLATSKGRSVIVYLRGATNLAPVVLEIELTGYDNQLANLPANVKQITDINVDPSIPQIGANLVNIKGNAVDPGLPQIGVNVMAWFGGPVRSPNQSGVPIVDVSSWNGTAVTSTIAPDALFIRSGKAQAGGASSITLDSGASSTTDFYKNETIFIRSGIGAGQSNIISAYNGSTKVATLVNTWATNPDGTSNFSIIAAGPTPLTTANVTQWNGTAVATPATAGIPEVNVKNINNVATTSVTTVSANQGTTQPVNFTGSAGSALVKSDAVDIAGVAVSTATAQIGVNVVQYNSQTAQTDVNNLPKVDLEDIVGAAVSTTTAQLGVNTVKYNNHTAQTDANNLPKVDVEDWKAGVVATVNVTGVPKVDLVDVLGTAPTAATAGILDVNVKNMNNVSGASITTINANQGTTQPINFTGTAASALAKSDMVDVAGAAVSTSTAQIGVNAVNWAGGAIPSPNVTGVPKVDVVDWLGTGTSAATAGIPDVNAKNINNVAAATPPTTAQIATGVWQDATVGDFTTASSIGKSLYTSGVVPGGTNGLFIAGTNAATTISTALTTTFTGNLTGSVGSVTGAVGSVTGSVGSVVGAVGSVTGAVGSVTAAVTVGTNNDKTGYSLASNELFIQKNATRNNFPIFMTDSTTHAPKTGLTLTTTVSIDGGAFGATVNSATERSSGLYYLNLAAADTNGDIICIRATATNADDFMQCYKTQA